MTEKEKMSNTTYYSKQNTIETTKNTTYARTSEKYKMNNLYLKCDPVHYLNYAKNRLRGFLPKYYYSDKKAYVNIVEAEIEMNQDDFKDIVSILFVI